MTNILRRQFRQAGLQALAYDIMLDPAHDITSRVGFYQLLDMAFQ